MLSLLVLVSCLTVRALGAFPPSITIQGVARDFSASHVNFEPPVEFCREQRGLFAAQLTDAPDSRPISTPPELRTDSSLKIYPYCNDTTVTTRYALSNFGQAYTDEMYQDVPGVNVAIPVEIVLALVDAVQGVYEFKSDSFFPINQQGFARELMDPLSTSGTARTLNYWFTTEFRVQFFYRAGQVFQFTGDDDLWVFIDGQLTSCDLGSIHKARPCNIQLDSLGLLQNSSYEMAIFHAERHYKGSTFQITTSIVPENRAPRVGEFGVITSENVPVAFPLQGFDPDYNPRLRFMILSRPTRGSIDAQVDTWLPVDGQIVYTPDAFFSGNDSFTYIMTDNMANSTVGTVNIAVNRLLRPPTADPLKVTVTRGDRMEIKLVATDIDTVPQDLRFYITSQPEHGYATIPDNYDTLIYDAVTVGIDTIKWQVSDGTSRADSTLKITVVPPPTVVVPLLQPNEVAGIIVGSVALFAILALVGVYFVYYYIAAKRFEQEWQREFYAARVMTNPLYKEVCIEGFNPLYTPRSGI